MHRLCAPLTGIALLLAVSAAPGQDPKPDNSGDATSPALLKLIQDDLATSSGLRPSDGVRIDSVKYSRGELRVRGQVKSAEQKDAVRRRIEADRARLDKEADVRITSVDVSELTISGPPLLPGDGGPAAALRGRPLPGHWPYNCPPVFISWTPPPSPRFIPHICQSDCWTPDGRCGHGHCHRGACGHGGECGPGGACWGCDGALPGW